MMLKNTEMRYGTVAAGLHWLLALLIIALLCVGLYMVRQDPGPQMFKLYGLHKSIGITVLALAALHIDYIHSTVLAVLVGIIVPAYTRTEVRLWAVMGFLFLQVMTYTVTVFAALVILPAIIPAGWAPQLGTLGITLIVFFAVRESLIALFWRRLLHLTNTNSDDTACVFSFAR